MFASVVIHESTKKGMSHGYSITLFDGDAVIATYSAGGHPCESQAPGESPLSTVRSWGISTAKEMFAEQAGREPASNEIEIEIESPYEE